MYHCGAHRRMVQQDGHERHLYSSVSGSTRLELKREDPDAGEDCLRVVHMLHAVLVMYTKTCCSIFMPMVA